ncbi:hypothetical protein RDV78_07040 [Bacillota bacterium LX-D]|nr:hypothetical protein [Bacillota bacterium LX-D]
MGKVQLVLKVSGKDCNMNVYKCENDPNNLVFDMYPSDPDENYCGGTIETYQRFF